MDSQRIDIKNLSMEDLEQQLTGLGKEKFRARQIMHWIYVRKVTSFDQMTDLSKGLREELSQRYVISDWRPHAVQVSNDGTRKYLFRLADGESIETVRIPMEGDRSTLCISTQVGCAMNCQFCLTGTFQFTRNLTPGEMVNQVMAVQKEAPVQNIVMMGMGEPLHNLDNVIKALEIFYMNPGLDFGPRRVTLSTCGLVPQMIELGERIEVNLAVSLNATTDETRSMLMPINRKHPISELMRVCRDFPLKPRQRITFEYILIRDVNDTLVDAKRLVKLLHGIQAKVNLIPFNEHEGSKFRAPRPEQVDLFQSYLLNRKIVTIRRASKGRDISAACGQLKAELDRDT